MASQFQNRLLGTVILVTIGVIVLPDVFDGQKEHHQEESFAVPIAPETESTNTNLAIEMPLTVDTSSNPSDDTQQVITSQEDDASSQQPNSNQATSSSQADTTIEDVAQVEPTQVNTAQNTFQGSGWIIQLMSLKNKDNALGVVADLKKRGYVASIQETNSDWIRVLVGPDVSKQKLEAQIAELEDITGSKGQVRAYNPTNP